MKHPPGITRHNDEHAKLAAVLAHMPKTYVPRTHLKDGNHPKYINRLIHQPSPYLLQHAHNPVDWWPWGPDALAEAVRRDVPIFLSAGYATCHWCHVMEEESFDNEQVAEVLNRHFVAVKLDREQRPDVDQVYITATSLQHRHAGWPNSVWMLPDGKPFHTGTYFQRPHFIQILSAIAQQWQTNKRAEFESFATTLADAVQNTLSRSKPAQILDTAAQNAVEHLNTLYNPQNGGFSTGQQFPHEGNILFLLDHFRRSGQEQSLDIACHCLAEMAAGGFHDHVGGGFHRYTVDVNWRTPHFEKMIYNQSLLAQCYCDAFNITGDKNFARVVERLVHYVARDMTAPDGAIYTAEDADSLDSTGKLEEGAFYVWPPAEAMGVLHDTSLVDVLGLRQPPTLEAGPVAHLAPETSPDFDVLDAGLERLRLARDARPRPLRDEKVITGWNGLMITGLARAAMTFNRPEWREQAERAAEAVFDRLSTDDGLMRIHGGGRALEPANLTDYVWLAQGCLAIRDAGGANIWQDRAQDLATEALKLFAMGGGRFALSMDGPLGPVQELEDGAIPSGESSLLELLTDLALRDGSEIWKLQAESLLSALSGHLADMPVVRMVALRAAEVLRGQESGFLRHLADGKLRLLLVRGIMADWHLDLTLADGLHIEPETMQLDGIALTNPPPTLITGNTRLEIETIDPTARLTLQVCTDSMCYAPETLTFRCKI